MSNLTKLGIGLVLVVCYAVAARAAEPEKLNFTVSGKQRQALVFAPTASIKSGASPLVFIFHGHGGSAQNISRTMHIQTLWPEAIVVFMQGVPTPTKIDPAGKKDGWQRAPGDQGDRDIKFFDTVLSAMHKKFKVDDKRVYVTGFSNGGVFTYVLWAARPNVVAAVAPCAGLPLPGVHMSVPKPALIVAGDADPIVSIQNQRQMIEEVRKLNHADTPGAKTSDGAILYKSSSGTPVETYLHPGGHILPAEVPKMVTNFFRNHELN